MTLGFLSFPKRTFLLSLILLSACSLRLSAEETLRLEGVIEDKTHHEESLAVINGGLYKIGDEVSGHYIEAIRADEVTLIHSGTKQALILHPKAAAPKPDPAPSASAPASIMDQAKSYLKNPAQIANRVWEIKALRDLAIINNAAVTYYEKNKFFPVSMKQLTLDGFLPKEYEAGDLNKYHFYFTNKPQKPDALELHADPLEKNTGLRFLFIGADAVIREAEDGPADLKCKPHDYPGKR